MRLHTASEVISLARKLESETASFYERLRQYGEGEELWHAFAQENRRNTAQVDQAYRGAISDAIESGFAFDLEENNYAVDLRSGLSADHNEALKNAIISEKQIARFYSDAAQQSQSLLADVPRVFRQMAQKRRTRIEMLEALLADPR